MPSINTLSRHPINADPSINSPLGSPRLREAASRMRRHPAANRPRRRNINRCGRGVGWSVGLTVLRMRLVAGKWKSCRSLATDPGGLRSGTRESRERYSRQEPANEQGVNDRIVRSFQLYLAVNQVRGHIQSLSFLSPRCCCNTISYYLCLITFWVMISQHPSFFDNATAPHLIAIHWSSFSQFPMSYYVCISFLHSSSIHAP